LPVLVWASVSQTGALGDSPHPEVVHDGHATTSDLCRPLWPERSEAVSRGYGGSRWSACAGGSEKASAASSTALSVSVKRPACWRRCSSQHRTLKISTN